MENKVKDEKYGVGKVFKNTKNYEFKIIENLKNGRRLVEFVNSGYRSSPTVRCIQLGQVSDKSRDKYQIGESFETNEGCTIEIIGKVGNDSRMVRFKDNYGYETIVKVTHIKHGKIKNPYHPSVYGIGYLGEKSIVGIDDKIKYKKAYQIWMNMLDRCYNKNRRNKYPTYENVTVCEEWLCFNNFLEWFNDNYIEGYHLDKDLLNGDNGYKKEYNSRLCVFIPPKVNIFLTKTKSTNSSGARGVCFDKSRNKYMASIHSFLDGKEIYLGRFATIEEASSTYTKAREIQCEKVKDYLRSLNYLPEEIIELVR